MRQKTERALSKAMGGGRIAKSLSCREANDGVKEKEKQERIRRSREEKGGGAIERDKHKW